MNNKKVLSLNWNEYKELLEVHENGDVHYLVVDNRTGKEVKFDYYENESAIAEFWSFQLIEEDKEDKEDEELINNTKMKVPKKYVKMLKEIDNEGRHSGIWAYSREGYQFGITGTHTLHEYNQKDLMAGIRTLQKCECKDCIEH